LKGGVAAPGREVGSGDKKVAITGRSGALTLAGGQFDALSHTLACKAEYSNPV